jgi:hypothetical protein
MSAWSRPLKVEAELPKVTTETIGFRNESLNMNNLPASLEINGALWTRTASASQNGTYSYGANGGTSSDIATNAHYTVSPYPSQSSKIYNVHYTVPSVSGPTRYYYYVDEPKDRRYVPALPDANARQLKYMVDKLLFRWTWFYTPTSAYGPATQQQVS